MFLSRTTTKIIVIVIFFIFLSGYTSLQDGINQDPPPKSLIDHESLIQSKTNWIKTFFARIPNLNFGVRDHYDPRIIKDDKITVKEGVRDHYDPRIITDDKITVKEETVTEVVTMTFSEGMTTLEETAKSAAETTKDKIHQTATNVKDTIFPPHDDHNHDEPNHEL